MKERYTVLYKLEQSYLRLAIERAVTKKFAPVPKRYKDLNKAEKNLLRDEFGLSPQSLDRYMNGGEEISCYPTSLNRLCAYIDEKNWDEYLEKKRREALETEKKFTTLEEITTDPVRDQHTSLPRTKKDLDPARPKNIRRIAVYFLIPILMLVLASRRLTTTDVRAELVVKAVTVVLKDPLEIKGIQVNNYLRLDSTLIYGAPFLDGVRAKLTANADTSNHPVRLEQFNIPSGVRVTFENPIQSQLFVRLFAQTDVAGSIEGKISNYHSIVLNKRDTVSIDSIKSLTKVITFKTSLHKDKIFELAVVNGSNFEIPSMIIDEVRFQKKENFYDTKTHSSIVSGNIFFIETADSVPLDEFDDLSLTLNKPSRLTLMPDDEGIHIKLQGIVDEVLVGSEHLNSPLKNLMPKLYLLLINGIPASVWMIVLAVLPGLMSWLWKLKES